MSVRTELSIGVLPASTTETASFSIETDLASMQFILAGIQAESQHNIRKQPFKVHKLRQNIEHVRTWFLRLEEDAQSLRPGPQQKLVSKKLNKFRSAIKDLSFLLLDMAPVPAQPGPSRSESEATVQTEQITLDAFTHSNPASPTSEFRNRRPKSEVNSTINSPLPALSTGNDIKQDILVEELNPEMSEREKQSALERKILEMTRELQRVQATVVDRIEQEDEKLNIASKAMDNTGVRLSGVQLGMNSIRKMAEGRGWLGRIWLYLYVAFLWVIAILTVFVMPKLRF